MTGIDEGTHDPEPLRNYKAYWSEAGVDRLKKQVTHIRACITQDGVILEEMAGFAPEDGEKEAKPLIRTKTRYYIHRGAIEIQCIVINESGLCTLPRIGRTFRLDKSFSKVTWYGRGPWENYCDRKDSALIGKYTDTVDGMHVPFIVPCECGGHEDVRFVELSDGQDTLKVSGGRIFISALCHTAWSSILGHPMRMNLGRPRPRG